jgi:hypothetical protein
MTRLNQIIAVEGGVKSDTTRQVTDLHHQVQKQALLSGISRTYEPRDREGDPIPAESTKVQISAEDVLAGAAKLWTRLYDVTLTKDVANTLARADVVVAGERILSNVPATFLLFLERQLTDLHTFVAKLPVQDPAEDWTAEGAPAGQWKSAPARTMRTKKVPRNHVMAEATAQHPAQVQMYHEDVPVGDWTTVKFTGALPARRVRLLLDRVTALQRAVKFAREEANSREVEDQEAGEAVFGWLFA